MDADISCTDDSISVTSYMPVEWLSRYIGLLLLVPLDEQRSMETNEFRANFAIMQDQANGQDL